MRMPPSRFLRTALVLPLALAASSCGFSVVPNASPYLETGTDGQTLLLDELKAIADDDELTDDQKRDRFLEMGIEDPDLIDALLDL